MYRYHRSGLALILAALLYILFTGRRANAQYDLVPIGQIQGRGYESLHIGQMVSFHGIVTGTLEQENARGIRFYTLYVQDIQENVDGDPLTSDGIAVFTGRNQLPIAIGDIIQGRGRVTEFYGLTEIDDKDLTLAIESRNNPLPTAIELAPPADLEAAEAYFEKYEGMVVQISKAIVVGPTHTGCGFAVVRHDVGMHRVIRRQKDDPVGQVINVLNNSDVHCNAFPSLTTGDEIEGIHGPLTFHFDRFKVIQENAEELPVTRSINWGLLKVPPGVDINHIRVATYNVGDYFDGVDDTGIDSEPQPTTADLALKQEKLAATISEILSCPTLVALQEVENRHLLDDLASLLVEPCGFEYLISHIDGPDIRGMDLALLGDPTRVVISSVLVSQSCSTLDTGLIDPDKSCEDGEEPLFSRPPLQVEIQVDDRPMTLIVNHFKSKRGGELETEPRRLAQAKFVNKLVQDLSAENRDAAVIVLGDFNDYELSSVKQSLTASGALVDGLAQIPDADRYSYNFDGSSQLVDWILISPILQDEVVDAYIAHANSDFPHDLASIIETNGLPLRSSDHDIPVIVLQSAQETLSGIEESVSGDLGNASDTLLEGPDQEADRSDLVNEKDISDKSSSMNSESVNKLTPDVLERPKSAAETIRMVLTSATRSISPFATYIFVVLVVVAGFAIYFVKRKL